MQHQAQHQEAAAVSGERGAGLGLAAAHLIPSLHLLLTLNLSNVPVYHSHPHTHSSVYHSHPHTYSSVSYSHPHTHSSAGCSKNTTVNTGKQKHRLTPAPTAPPTYPNPTSGCNSRNSLNPMLDITALRSSGRSKLASAVKLPYNATSAGDST